MLIVCFISPEVQVTHVQIIDSDWTKSIRFLYIYPGPSLICKIHLYFSWTYFLLLWIIGYFIILTIIFSIFEHILLCLLCYFRPVRILWVIIDSHLKIQLSIASRSIFWCAVLLMSRNEMLSLVKRLATLQTAECQWGPLIVHIIPWFCSWVYNKLI